MASPTTCPTCGTAIEKAGEPCPRCLLELGRARTPEPPRAGSTSAPRARRRADPPVEELAKRFPELEIAARIGSGGMGAVYKARQPRIDRWVALKILSLDPADDPTFAERFRREAVALARLDHPNVVKLYDFGERDGLFFLLLEFVDGPNLRTLMKQGLLQPAQALAVVPQMCEALQFAHDEGIIHRDIKPENVLLDAKGRVKIADFGLAKLVDADARDVSLTEVDQIVGTPHYMAPEQIRGSREVDHRADIYSLGVVFYEMLTGELPRGNFELPSRRVRVDVRLDEIVLKSLERAPERRYQHAVEVKTDVESVGDGTPGSAKARAESGAATGGEGDRPYVAGISIIRVKRERERERVHDRPKLVIHPDKTWEFFLTFLILWPLAGWAWNGGGWVFAIAMALVGATFWSMVDRAIRRRPELDAALTAESRSRKAIRHIASLALLVAGLFAIFAGEVAVFRSLCPGYRENPSDPGSVRAALWNQPSAIDAQLVEGLPIDAASSWKTQEVGIWSLDHERIWREPILVPMGFFLLVAAVCALIARRGQPGIAPAIAATSTLLLSLALVQGPGFVSAVQNPAGGRLVPILDPELAAPEGPVSDRGTEVASQRLRVALLRRGYQIVEQGTWSLTESGRPPAGVEVQMIVTEPSSPFDRWRLGWFGPERRWPRDVFVLTGSRDHGPVTMRCTLGEVQVDSPLRRESRAWTKDVLAEIEDK